MRAEMAEGRSGGWNRKQAECRLEGWNRKWSVYILTDLANHAEGAEWKCRVSLDSEVLPQVTYFCQPGHT